MSQWVDNFTINIVIEKGYYNLQGEGRPRRDTEGGTLTDVNLGPWDAHFPPFLLLPHVQFSITPQKDPTRRFTPQKDLTRRFIQQSGMNSEQIVYHCIAH